MQINKKISFLSVANEPYIPIVSSLLKSASEHHPDIKFNLVIVNTSEESNKKLKSLHPNLNLIKANAPEDKNKKLQGRLNLAFGQHCPIEQWYCMACRTWFMSSLMNPEELGIFYMDADVVIGGKIDKLFNFFKNSDIMVRAKDASQKNFKCNVGMVWIKNSKKMLDIIKKWEERTKQNGQIWGAEQLALNDIVKENWDKILYKNFPLEYNGLDNNPKSIITHYKGIACR
jgi:lipopolysaccharide biosynthesis glycosyltransferase